MSLQKQKPIVSNKLRKAAEGQQCTMMSPECSGDSNRVAFRHLNSLNAGQGWGRKADDLFGFDGCQECENWYALGHAPRDLKDSYALNAMIKTQRNRYDMGILKVA